MKPKRYRKSATVCCSNGEAPRTFQITHPFHPRCGSRFILSNRHQVWGEDRVLYFDAKGRLRSILTAWTDVQVADAFALASAGRSWFRLDDLLRLRALIDASRSGADVK